MLGKLFGSLLFVSLLQVGTASARELPDFTELVEKQGASVVNISTTQIIHGAAAMPGIPEGDPFYEFFRRFAPQAPQDQETRSLGSGFIVSGDGYILTNAHVVNGADKVTVRLSDKREFNAKMVGADRRTDVALLKIEAANLPKVATGDPANLKVGEWVLAIGSPFGFDSSVTAGIVSAKGRTLPQENYVPFIQTDVAINPGNSGGPLFNMKGEVVGINSQIYSRSGGYMGLSFAIPIDVAMDVANQLRSNGKVTRGRMGVAIEEMTREKADSFGLEKIEGALISTVEKGSPADKAGIRFGDVVLKFNGKPIASSRDLPRLVAATHPGSKVPVEVWRSGAVQVLTMVVGAMPDDKQALTPAAKPAAESAMLARLGVSVVELTVEQKQQLQVNGGLLIDEVKGVAARAAELQRGDVILALGNLEIVSLAQLNEVLKQVPKGRNVALLVRRGNSAFYVPIRLDEK